MPSLYHKYNAEGSKVALTRFAAQKGQNIRPPGGNARRPHYIWAGGEMRPPFSTHDLSLWRDAVGIKRVCHDLAGLGARRVDARTEVEMADLLNMAGAGVD